jgi:hypothetical protein
MIDCPIGRDNSLALCSDRFQMRGCKSREKNAQKPKAKKEIERQGRRRREEEEPCESNARSKEARREEKKNSKLREIKREKQAGC